ncbi:A-kinase anchor protein 9-like isoform X3 [Rhopilema esculentum]|uniref:A-kinase anchor protein 9-like isoform X3 n=1 Tax=Rhopilema esculentum TaxID=499914 RepID=UPI0031CEE46E
MSDSETERQRKLKAGRAKLMEFKQMKKRKKKEEAAATSKTSGNQSQNNSQSGSQPVAKEVQRTVGSQMSSPRAASGAHSGDDFGDQNTENDAASISSAGNSLPVSPIPHEGGDNSYTSDSEYTSAEESYTYSEDGVDSLVVANLERNELKSRVVELEENLRGKQSVIKDLNKENYELRAKLHTFQSGSRQESSPSPVLRKELESLQETLNENQKRLEDINKENHEMRAKLAHTGHDDRSSSSKMEELNLSLESKQQMLEALNFQNEELIKENNKLKSRLKDQSPDNSQSDSQVESLRESLHAKHTVLSELNKQNQELREKIHELSQSGASDSQMQSFRRKIADLQSELGLKDDEIERLKAIEISFMQTKEVVKELTLHSNQAKEDLKNAEKRRKEIEDDNTQKEKELLQKCSATILELEKVQAEYHNIVALNNDHLMKINILESEITRLDAKLNEKEKKIAEVDTQVSLAIGERDAVQLETRAQVEDFEERIKVMQEQLLQNGTTLREYESEISKATAELASTKVLVQESEKALEKKDQDIKLLEMKVEATNSEDSRFNNDRKIYLDEIETLKEKVEESQSKMKGLNDELREKQAHYSAVLSQKEDEIQRLERERTETEQLRADDVDNLQSHYDLALQEQMQTSIRNLEDEIRKLEAKKVEDIQGMEKDFEAKLVEMKAGLDKAKHEEILRVRDEIEAEQKVQLEAVRKQVTEAIVQQGAEETRKILEDSEYKITQLDQQLALKETQIDEFKAKIDILETAFADKEEELDTFKEKARIGKLEIEGLNEELMNRLKESELKITDLESILGEKELKIEEDMRVIDILSVEKTELAAEKEKDLKYTKEEYEEKMKIKETEIMNLKNSAEKEKVEFLQFIGEVEVVKKQLSEAIANENRLKENVSSLENDKNELQEHLLKVKDERNDFEQLVEKFENENKKLKETVDQIEMEKTSFIAESELEVGLLKERMEVMKSENNNEMMEKFNQTFEKLRQEKDEHIKNLKDEMMHSRESSEKYVQKLKSDFECDMKHVEDENQSLKIRLKEIKEVRDRDKVSHESGLEREMEALEEKHRRELAEVKAAFEKKSEEDHLSLKENQWQYLKRFEAERDAEMKRFAEDFERRKEEEVELLKHQLEEEKHKEVHDVVCNMTKEQKDATSQIKDEMERQLKRVQEERDAELRSIQQEYLSFKEMKKLEMEEMLATQIAKYQEEQDALQKKLSKAESRLRKTSNEKEELVKQLGNRSREDTEDVQRKLKEAEDRLDTLLREKEELEKQISIRDKSVAEEEVVARETDSSLKSEKPFEIEVPLQALLEDLRSEILNLSMDETQSFGKRKISEKLSEDKSGEEFESSLDRELSEITRLCKGQIVDLAYKLKETRAKYENSEKTRNDISDMNQTLKEELANLKALLKNNEEELNRSYEVNEDLKGTASILQAEVDRLAKAGEDGGFDATDGKDRSLLNTDIEFMNNRLAEISNELELKWKQKEELDRSLMDVKSEISFLREEKGRREPVIEEDVSVVSMQHEEVAIVPEFLEELYTTPLEEVDGPENEQRVEAEEASRKEQVASFSFDKDLELKHLQKLLIDSNEKQEQQKREIKELREALENERMLFAEQLRARVGKETEVRTAQENTASEVLLREKKDAANKIGMLEQKLKEKEKIENDLKDENWRLVNLLKENNIELYNEKELLQDQLEKQEDIIKELHEKLSTSDLVTNEIQEAFGRQLAALHRQRDALIEQLEQHRKDHQGYARVVQEKATLEDRLREEKKLLSEKLSQKEALEMELAAEREALNEKLIELEKLREMLNGKEKLTDELTKQRDELKTELTSIEERLSLKEKDLSIEREELERELELKDLELQKWEEDFRARENELLEQEDTLRENFSNILQSTRNDYEVRNEDNLRQLRTDLDSDYRDRIAVTEEGLHRQYGEKISKIEEEHECQLRNWLDLSDWLLDSMLSLPCFKMSRAKAGFEAKLLDLRRQLDEERLRQVKTVKEVLEREHSREKIDLLVGHDSEMYGLKSDLTDEHQLELDRLRREFETSHQSMLEDLQASLITESAIRIGAARLAAEQELERHLKEMRQAMEEELEKRMEDVGAEKDLAVEEVKAKCEEELRGKVDEVMREMQAEKEAELEKIMNDASSDLQERIRLMQAQLVDLRDPQRVQARMELDNRHENKVEKVKSELVQKCGDDDEMFHTLGEFESVQEDYFQERLKCVQEEHEIHVGNIIKEYEIMLLKTKNELDVLREDDFQRIRRLQDEIYAKEEAILEMRKAHEEEKESLEKELAEEKNSHDRDIARKTDEQIAIVAKEKEVWNFERERELDFMRTQFEGRMIEKDAECEEKMRNLQNWYENEMQRREMEFIQREEIMKEHLGQRSIQAQFQELENQHAEQMRMQDEKHRQDLEQAVVQLSASLKEDFNKIMADMKTRHEEEKTQMRKDFVKVKRDELDDLREKLAADYNIELKEMKVELEHKKFTEIAEITTQISLKNAMDLENVRTSVTEKYQQEMEAIKKELQDDFQRNALRHAAEIEDMEISHAEELRLAKRSLTVDEVEAIKRAVEEDFAENALNQARQIEELELRHAEELKRLREKYEAEEVEDVRREMQEGLAQNALRLALQMEELESRHAGQLKHLRQKYERDEVDGARADAGRKSPVDLEQAEEVEKKHKDDLKQVKHKYEKLLHEKTQELQSEVNVLRSLLEGGHKQLRKISKDYVDAVPSAPPFHDMPGGSFESLVVPTRRFGEGATPSSSTETLIARFADGEVVNALNDALQDISSDEASRAGTSLTGSLPSLFNHVGARYPGVRHDGGHDEVEQNREAVIREMRRRFRPSESDSGKSYDQMMEMPLMEEERLHKLLREKDDETRHQLEKQREEYDHLYQGRIQELERENAQMEEYIHQINSKHERDISALKDKSLALAEQKLDEVKEEAAVEKVELQKEAHENLEKSKMELIEKHEKMLKKFMKQQDDLTQELKNEHIDELGMLKHELTMKNEKQVKEVERKHHEYLLQTRDKYEKLLHDEREKFERKHAEDAKRLKNMMEKKLETSQKDLVEVLKDQYDSDLKRIKMTLEEDKRQAVEDAGQHHKVELERAKENVRREMSEKFKAELEGMRETARREYDDYMRRDLTERVAFEIDRAREEARQEYEEIHSFKLRQLENQLEETHVQQLQTLQDMHEKHKSNIDELKKQHEEEIRNLEDSGDEKFRSMKESLQEERMSEINAVELSLEKDVDKIKQELEEAHKKELEELKNELISANAKLTALDKVKSGTEKTYMETIKTLHEDYENEISKLKEAIESIRDKQLESQDKNVLGIYNTDHMIIKQNFEQQIAQMKKHYEILMSDMEKNFEVEKRHWLEEHMEKQDKKLEEIKKSYEDERKDLHHEVIAMDDEHVKQLDSVMDKVKSLTAELHSAHRETKELKEENQKLVNKVQVASDQYNTLVARHERQEEENSKYIKMISSDVDKCEQEKGKIKNASERVLQTLSNAVRTSVLIEDLINRRLDTMIQEASRTESGLDASRSRGGANGGGHHGRGFRLFGTSPSKSKKDKTLSDTTFGDTTQYSNLSGGSLLSDEGLDLSFVSREHLFSGAELDANGEEIVRGVGERLHTAVEHLLKMLSLSTRQTNEARQSYDDAVARSSEAEEEHKKRQEEIAENLKKALKDLEKEGKLKSDWEKDARQKQSDLQSTKKENSELRHKVDELQKDNRTKNDDLRSMEEKLIESEAEKEVLAKFKKDLEMNLADLRTHQEKEIYRLKLENKDLEGRLSKAVSLSGDDFQDVLAEIYELKEEVETLSEEKEKLRGQLKEAKTNMTNASQEAERLRLNISETLQSNIDLAQQNEALRKKNKSLESAFEETLEERRIAQEEAASREGELDDVDGPSSTNRSHSTPGSPGSSPSGQSGRPEGDGRDTADLLKEIQNLKDIIESFKENNDALSCELDQKHETELELLNKITELEDDLYKSANEGFESEREEKGVVLHRKRSLELNFKLLASENDKLKTDMQKQETELEALQADLKRAKELLADKENIFEELSSTKSVLENKNVEFSQVNHDRSIIKQSLKEKEKQLTAASAELAGLKETVHEQRSTIDNQQEKIRELLEKQGSEEEREQHIKGLEEEINREREMVLEKDNEIQALLEKLNARRSQGDGEDAETKSKKVKILEEKLNDQQEEIKQMKQAILAADEERQLLVEKYELNLQKTIHHIKKEMEKASNEKIARLKEEHQNEIDNMLEVSRVEMSELGQKFEEQIGAAERVNLQLLEHFFKNRTLNESQMPVAEDEGTPVESLLNELQTEAEKIAHLVTSYQINADDIMNIQELQNSWAKEKQILLEAVKALRELVSRASNAAATDAENVGEDWRAGLLKAIEEVFNLESDFLSAEIETLERVPESAEQPLDLATAKRKRLGNQRKQHSQTLNLLSDQERESYLQEISRFRVAAEELEQKADSYKELLEDLQSEAEKAEVKADNLTLQYNSQASLVDQERAASAQLRSQVEQEKIRNLELEKLISNERDTVSDLQRAAEIDEEKITDLIKSLENERKELKNIRAMMAKEQSSSQALSDQITIEKKRSSELEKHLAEERKRLEEIIASENENLEDMKVVLSEESEKNQQLSDLVGELKEERNRLLKAAELDQAHAQKIEGICEELKSKAAQEKNERQRLEKIAERYHANLEEMRKLFDEEKKRRIEQETALKEQRDSQSETEEKGQHDAREIEKLETMLGNLRNELDRADAKVASQDAEIMSLKSESALKISDIKKQNAERLSETVAKCKRESADELDRERATSKQLRDALQNLQLKYETSRSQYERMRESIEEVDGPNTDRGATPEKSPRGSCSLSSRALDPFITRCTKLVTHCQDVIVNEQQRMTYGAERPSERHIKELQSTHDALAALVQELSHLQQDLRALEENDQSANSPLARLEQAHNKNEELRDHIRKLVKEKSEFRVTLSALEEQVMEYRKREAEVEAAHELGREAQSELKSEQLRWEAERSTLKSDLLKLEAERNAMERALDKASIENANLKNSPVRSEVSSQPDDNIDSSKVAESGWTLQKIQKLYGRCLRAESFRKALIYQKKYLLFLLGGFQETEAITLSMIAKITDVSHVDGTRKQPYGKSKAFMRFRTAARVVIATWRMKFLVKKWSKSMSKITLKSSKKPSNGVNTSPSAPLELVPERTDKYTHSKPAVGNDNRGQKSKMGDSRSGRAVAKVTEPKHRNGIHSDSHSSDQEAEPRRRRQRGVDHVTTRQRRGRFQRDELESEPSSYSAARDVDRSPPRAYPRPASPMRSRESPPVLDSDFRYFNTHSSVPSSRSRSPASHGPSPNRRTDTPNKHQRSLSASGLDETNTSLNAYIKKLEMLQARLKSQGADSSNKETRRF